MCCLLQTRPCLECLLLTRSCTIGGITGHNKTRWIQRHDTLGGWNVDGDVVKH